MVFLDRPKKILIASSSGVVLLLGFLALKARAGEVPTPEQQQELSNSLFIRWFCTH